MNAGMLLQQLENEVMPLPGFFAHVGKVFFRTHRHRYAHDLGIAQRFFPRNARILELGAHPYHHTFLLTKSGYDVVAVDKKPDRLNAFVQKHHLRVRKGDVTKRLPFADGSFDVVWFTELLEHLTDPIAALLEANRVLKKNGLLYLTTPNQYALTRIGKFALGRGLMPDAFMEFVRPRIVGHHGHIREYTRNELFRFLSGTGFFVRRHVFRSHTRKHVKKFPLADHVLNFVMALVPLVREYQVVLAQKSEDGKTALDRAVSAIKATYTQRSPYAMPDQWLAAANQ